MKSVSLQLQEYLHGIYPNKTASGNLQRGMWHNRNGTLASPKAISRRLQELAEDKILNVEYVNKHAHYSWNDGKDNPERKKEQIVEYLDSGAVKISYV